MESWDVVVIGCGAMGSATSYHLSKRGVKALVLERFELNHENGSSHGHTRIIRRAYFERPHPTYVQLTARSYELWDLLQQEYGQRLLEITGGLNIGARGSMAIAGTIDSAAANNIPHRILSAQEVKERFQIFNLSEDEFGVYEPGVGVLFPELCIQAHYELALKAGVEFHFHESAVDWKKKDGKLVITTDRSEYLTDRLILTCGPWIQSLLKGVSLPVQCERQVPIWFEPKAQRKLFKPGRMPAFAWVLANNDIFYGLPDYGQGTKVARHHGGALVSPDEVDRNVRQDDEAPVRKFLREHMPLANGKILEATTCLYTNTPDHDFIIDFHPTNGSVLIVSACSGHAFKFACSIGELAASLVTEGRYRINTENFGLKRFRSKS